MRLSIEDIRKHTRGITYVEECDGAFCFHRYSAAQEALFMENVPNRGGAPKATTGVVIDFITDSENLSLKLYKIGEGESRYSFDVYENDLLIYSAPMSCEKIDHHIKLSTGKSRVRIYPCSHTSARVADVEIDDGATLEVPEYSARALIFGDSITQGARALHTSLSYANIVTAHFGWNAVNYAIGGEVFREWLPGDENIHDPDIITVAYGTNDWAYKTLDFITENATGFFARLNKLYPDVRKIYISPTWRASHTQSKPAGDFFKFVELLENIARDAGATVIHGLDMIPPIAAFYEDGLHPNEIGYSIYARNLIRALEKEGVR